tara:strand:- start:287 stop:736 length:450 start_codon:yes stop_codon:yes gene_type:complete
MALLTHRPKIGCGILDAYTHNPRRIMAYDRNELETMAVEAIKKNRLFFIQDVIAYLPCTSSTFYNIGLEKSESIKEALTEIKTNIKVSMRSKWYLSEQPTLQLALMKLISSEEELRKLSMTHNVLEEKEKPIFNGIDINVAEDNGPGQD